MHLVINGPSFAVLSRVSLSNRRLGAVIRVKRPCFAGLALIAAIFGLPTVSSAMPSTADLPPKPLAAAHQTLAAPAGLLLMVNRDLFAGSLGPVLQGNLEPTNAFRHLLGSRGSRAAITGSGGSVGPADHVRLEVDEWMAGMSGNTGRAAPLLVPPSSFLINPIPLVAEISGGYTPALANPVYGFISGWQARVEKAQAEQPHWMTPLVTVTPRLEQEVRYDQYWETRGNGSTLNIFDAGKGLELIPTETNEVLINPPAYQYKEKTKNPANGWLDDQFLVVKQRLLTANEKSGNYIVTAFLVFSLY